MPEFLVARGVDEQIERGHPQLRPVVLRPIGRFAAREQRVLPRFLRQLARADNQEPCFGLRLSNVFSSRQQQVETAFAKIAGRDETHDGRGVAPAEPPASPCAELLPRGRRESVGLVARVVHDDALGPQREVLDERRFHERGVRDQGRAFGQREKELALGRGATQIGRGQKPIRVRCEVVHEHRVGFRNREVVVDDQRVRIAGARAQRGHGSSPRLDAGAEVITQPAALARERRVDTLGAQRLHLRAKQLAGATVEIEFFQEELRSHESMLRVASSNSSATCVARDAPCGPARNGGPCRTRTYNQWIKSPLLYQLS